VRLGRTPYLTSDGQDAYADGWFRTRDRADLDDAGAVRLYGRSDSLVAVGGLKVDLTQVEAVLSNHPQVRSAVVVHDRVIEAYVAPAGEPPTPAELTAWCRNLLADYKMPKVIRILPELPRTPTGKLLRDRSALRAAVSAGA